MSIKPHVWLRVSRPDEVAETWEGVSEDLYKFLWGLVEFYGPPAPEPDVNAVSEFWDRIPRAEQKALNELARAEQAYAAYQMAG